MNALIGAQIRAFDELMVPDMLAAHPCQVQGGLP
jgi:hypothetical protein